MTFRKPTDDENVTEWCIEAPAELRSVRRKRWGVTQVHRKSCVLLRRYHPAYVWDCTPEKAQAEAMQPCALCLPEHGGRAFVPRPYNQEDDT